MNGGARRFLVIGIGELGRALALQLASAGAEVIAMDVDMRQVDAIKEHVAYAVQGDAQDVEALRAVEAHTVDAAVVTIGDAFESTVMTVAALKELGVRSVVARASNERQRRVLERLGATRVLSIEVEVGRELARTLLSPNVLDLHELAPGYDLVEVLVPAPFVGRTLAELDLRRRLGVQVVAIRRSGAEAAQLPEPDMRLQPGDILFVAGRREHLAKLPS